MKATEHTGEVWVASEDAADESPSVAIRRRREERPATPEEMAAFDAAAAKWMGSGRERMRELGFETTDEFMKAIRGR